MIVTIEGSINPSSALPRGERMTVERTAYVDMLLRGGYAVLIAEHREPEPVLSETQRQAFEANVEQAEVVQRAATQRAAWGMVTARAAATGRVTGEDVNTLEAEGLPVLDALGELRGTRHQATKNAIKRGEITDEALAEAGLAIVDAVGVPLVADEGGAHTAKTED